MTRAVFFEACNRYKVNVFNYSEQEVEEEIKSDIETLEKHASRR